MVRKRTRRYDSDDNDSDSDVELNFEEPAKREPKRYSLRERKRTLFTTDFDYYGLDDEEPVEVKKQSSDDEDFEVEAEPDNVDQNGGVTSYFEPDPDAVPENPEGLIDFEDIIRADIVVNRNKIDYDNLIQKTEIKLTQPSTQASPLNPQKKRRGRPPKNRSDSIKIEVETKIECQPDLGTSIQNIEKVENETPDEGKEENEVKHEAQESLPNGDVKDTAENEQTVQKQEPLVENLKVQQDPPDGVKVTEDDDDDDVILLEEKNQPVIVLDD